MEKTLDENLSIINENEKLIANILHDIKSPLYSIKIGLQNHLDSELNRDIFETTINTINYIEEFLLNYSFKQGKFENKIEKCNIREIINRKIKSYKYILINKNIKIDTIYKSEECFVNNINIFVSSIIGNLISNIALHAKENSSARIEIENQQKYIQIDFKNYHNSIDNNFSLGLNFCQTLAKCCKIQLKFAKTKTEVKVSIKIPNINYAD